MIDLKNLSNMTEWEIWGFWIMALVIGFMLGAWLT